jgi:hypothetical protein
MFTVLSNTRNANMYLTLAVTIAAVILLTITVAPSIVTPKPALIPVTAGDDAYVEYLRGEKTIYANPSALSNALTAYHIGEKAIYENAADTSSAMMAYHLGEKFVVPNIETAMWEYRQGEWGLK